MEGFVYGLDPASKNDYFGITIHQLPKFVAPGFCYYCEIQTMQPDGKCGDCGKPWPWNTNLPRLKTVWDATGMNSFLDALDKLEQDLFPKYPPTLIVADYTNEKTFTDLLRKDYGDERVEPVNFTIPSKTMLKEDGLSIIKMGYEFPNPDFVKNPETAQRIRNTVDQLIHEQVITTKSGKITFDHEPGKHNDLAISWELSIHGCLRYILRHVLPGGGAVGSRTASHLMKKRRPNVITNADLISELYKDGNTTVLGVSRYG